MTTKSSLDIFKFTSFYTIKAIGGVGEAGELLRAEPKTEPQKIAE